MKRRFFLVMLVMFFMMGQIVVASSGIDESDAFTNVSKIEDLDEEKQDMVKGYLYDALNDGKITETDIDEVIEIVDEAKETGEDFNQVFAEKMAQLEDSIRQKIDEDEDIDE
ncbi:MAG: hypothetical protein ACOCRL_02300, partial [Bacillota bacterium]